MFQAAQFFQAGLNRTAVPSQVKQVELVPGQVVRGTVLRTYPDQMALVQFGGVQVHAKMETNLEAGQKAWLQVQAGGQPVTLKVVSVSASAKETPEQAVEGLIRSLGLPVSKEAKTIVSALLQHGLPLTRENVTAFLSLTQHSGSSERLLQAFLFAVKQNLPLSRESVLSLHTFFSPNSLTQAIQQFRQQAELFFQQAGLAGQAGREGTPAQEQHLAGNPTRGLAQLVGQLQAALRQLPLDMSGAGRAQGDQPLAATGQQQGASSAAQPSPANAATVLPSPASVMGDAQSQANRSVQGPTGTGVAASANGGAAMPAAGGAGSSAQAQTAVSPSAGQAVAGQAAAASNQPAPQPEIPSTTQAPGNRGEPANVAGRPGLAGGQWEPYAPLQPRQPGQQLATGEQRANAGWQSPASSAGIPAQPSQADGQRITAAANPPVTGTPSASLSTASQPAVTSPLATDQASMQQGAGKGNPLHELLQKLGVMHERNLYSLHQPGAGQTEQRLESIKSMLLQLQAQATQLPAGLRDAVDTLLQQVTGQQLMLSQSASHTLAHVVMQIPLRTEHGEEAAFVQIEAKKQGGQLDAENCRLLFNLDMHHLGITMIDVNIVNKIVNVGIYNDQPWLDGLVHSMRDLFSSQLQELGYHLSALRVQELPKEKSHVVSPSQVQQYQGVDIRI